MAKYLIEVPHESEIVACAKAVEVLLKSGSHFISNANFGCFDGVHKAWLIVDVENKQEALGIVPPAFRSHATVVGLNRFTMEEIDELLRYHKTSAPCNEP